MKYAILIYRDEASTANLTRDEFMSLRGAYIAYTQALREANVHLGGEPLQPVSTATTVRIRDGERSVQDGPYAELKEQLAGFYLIDTPDLDSALEWAARCPGATFGTLEVRPLMSME